MLRDSSPNRTPRSVAARVFALREQLVDDGHDAGADTILEFRLEGHLRLPHSVRGWFEAAIQRVQRTDPDFPRLTPHDLRHTVASLAVAAGANVKAVQRMLGQASAAMTLDVYADLFEEDLDRVGEALDAARRTAVSGAPES